MELERCRCGADRGIIDGAALDGLKGFNANSCLRGEVVIAEAEAALGFVDHVVEKVFEGQAHGGAFMASALRVARENLKLMFPLMQGKVYGFFGWPLNETGVVLVLGLRMMGPSLHASI